MIACCSKEDLQCCKTYDNNPTFKAYKTTKAKDTTTQGLTLLLLCKIKQVFNVHFAIWKGTAWEVKQYELLK